MLVGENEQCKITDFGLARDVHEEGFYEKKSKVSYINGFCYMLDDNLTYFVCCRHLLSLAVAVSSSALKSHISD